MFFFFFFFFFFSGSARLCLDPSLNTNYDASSEFRNRNLCQPWRADGERRGRARTVNRAAASTCMTVIDRVADAKLSSSLSITKEHRRCSWKKSSIRVAQWRVVRLVVVVKGHSWEWNQVALHEVCMGVHACIHWDGLCVWFERRGRVHVRANRVYV